MSQISGCVVLVDSKGKDGQVSHEAFIEAVSYESALKAYIMLNHPKIPGARVDWLVEQWSQSTPPCGHAIRTLPAATSGFGKDLTAVYGQF